MLQVQQWTGVATDQH